MEAVDWPLWIMQVVMIGWLVDVSIQLRRIRRLLTGSDLF